MKSINLKKSMTAAVSCLTILLLGAGASFAQMPGGDKNSGGMNASMARFFGSHTNFIARAEARVLDKNQKETATIGMGFEMLAGKIRMDINVADVKSKEMSPEFAATFKQMGMEQMVTVLLPDSKLVLNIYPGLKSYATSPMSKEEGDAISAKYRTGKKNLGKETIDGHPCEKNEITLTNDKGEKEHALVWNATDLKDFPVQLQLTEDDQTLIMKFKDVKIGRPDSAHFEAPAGMAKFDNVNALMSDAVTKKMNAAPK